MEAGGPNLLQEHVGHATRPWGDVANPREHIDTKFRYLVYAINPYSKSTFGMFSMAIDSHQTVPINKEDGDQSINLLHEPERLAERVALACSLVDEKHIGTYGHVGIIVESPPENVVRTHFAEAGSFVMNKAMLLEQAKRNPPQSADQVLPFTLPTKYNEIDVLANNDGKKVQLTGFFYKVTEEGEPMDENLTETIKQHAGRLNLPIIAIKEPNPFRENEITRRDNELSVCFKGKRYRLKNGDSYPFQMIDQRLDSVFPPSEDIEAVLQFLSENGTSETEIQNLKRHYQEADRERQKPKITYDDQGNVQSVEKRTGYGKSEKKMKIGETGATSWAYVVQEARALNELMAGSYTSSTVLQYLAQTLNPQEIDEIVQEALLSVSGDKRQKLETWYQGVKDKTKKFKVTDDVEF